MTNSSPLWINRWCKANVPAWLLVVILVVGAVLRLRGIHWGVPTPDLPYVPFHPDEAWGMGVLSEIEFIWGDFNPVSAQREGTLAYYLWYFTSCLLYLSGALSSVPGGVRLGDADYTTVLIACRCVVALLDVGSILLIFAVVHRLFNRAGPALMGALIFAIIPFELIYAHFMRTHVVANFFAMLTVWLSTRLDQSDARSANSSASVPRKTDTEDSRKAMARIVCWVGVVAGLATATRYTTAIILVIPVCLLLSRGQAWGIFRKRWKARQPVLAIKESLFTPSIRQLLTFWLLGLFIGDPFLFLSPMQASEHLAILAVHTETSQFSLSGLLDPSRLVKYLTYLLPYGTLPGLWLLLYTGLIIVLLSRHLRQRLSPYLWVSLLYFVPMAKGYAGATYIRALIFLFPFLAIFTAAGLMWLWDQLFRHPFCRWILILIVASVVISTTLYDWAYVSAMTRQDPRIALYQYLKHHPQPGQIRVGTIRRDVDYFVKTPTLNLLSRVTIIEKAEHDRDLSDVDAFLVAAFEPQDMARAENEVQSLLQSGEFQRMRRFENPLTILGVTLQFDSKPHDLQYPFPVLILLER